MMLKHPCTKRALIPGMLLTALLASSLAHSKDCILDDRFYVNFENPVGNRPFVATVEPDGSDSDASASEMCACAKSVTWSLLKEYNEKFPAAHLRGVAKGGCEDYGDGGQMYKLYWRQ